MLSLYIAFSPGYHHSNVNGGHLGFLLLKITRDADNSIRNKF